MEASNESPPTPKVPKHRSPSYPSINLEKALERTQQLWDVSGKHPAPLESAMKAWDYSQKSSGGLQTIAALKQYGLAEDRGTGWSREIVLTKAARELLVYGTDRDSQDWKDRVRSAVFRPKIHQKLWDKYSGSLPDDSVILPYLRLERGFSDEAARDMLKRFRETIAFASVSDAGGTVSGNGADSESEEDRNGQGAEEIVTPADIKDPPPKPDPKLDDPKAGTPRTIQVTYSPTEWALVQGQFPMTEADWSTFLAVLQSMKPGLVAPDEPAES